MRVHSASVAVIDTARETERIAIVLASSGAAARSQLKEALENECDMNVIAETGHLGLVRQNVREHHPDVVVLGFNTHGVPTLAALEVLFSEVEDTRYVVMNIEQGAEQDALPDAIRLVASYEPAKSRSC